MAGLTPEAAQQRIDAINQDILNTLKRAGAAYQGRITGPSPFDFPFVSARVTVPQAEMRQAFIDYGYQAAREQLPVVAEKLEVALDAAISLVGAVDTGELKNSGSVTVTVDGLQILYTAPYANLIAYGGYITPYGNPNARPVYIAGRDWVGLAIDSIEL